MAAVGTPEAVMAESRTTATVLRQGKSSDLKGNRWVAATFYLDLTPDYHLNMTTAKAFPDWLQTVDDAELIFAKKMLDSSNNSLGANESIQRRLVWRMGILSKLDDFIDDHLAQQEESECDCELYAMSNAFCEVMALACEEIGIVKKKTHNLKLKQAICEKNYNHRVGQLRAAWVKETGLPSIN